MPDCKGWWVCRLEGDETPAGCFCILHSPDPEKNQEAFRTALAAHEHDKGGVFKEFVFPSSVAAADFDTESNLNFNGASFLGDVDFDHAIFKGQVNFGSARFYGTTSFIGTTFEGWVNFSLAKANFAMFKQNSFLADVAFNSTTFHADVYFDETHFGAAASFNDARFEGDARFWNSRFSGVADFRWATFGGPASFSEVQFASSVVFAPRPAREGTPPTPIFTGTELEFTGVRMARPDAVAFRDADLRQVLFENTDLRSIEFTGIRWPTTCGRICVFDEIRALKNEQTRPTLDALERMYRELKQNFETRHDYERAGDFHISENEMRRRNPGTPTGLKCLLTLYWLLSGYGERYGRPLICAAVLLFGVTAAELQQGVVDRHTHQSLSIARARDWLALAHYNLRTILLLRPTNLDLPSELARVFDTFLSIAGPLVIGLFALSLRQRLRR
jgi:uncharacterized protein YjbI with pentapeptide repeats